MIAADYEFPRLCIYQRDANNNRRGVVHSMNFIGQNNAPVAIVEDQVDGKFYIVSYSKITMIKHDT